MHEDDTNLNELEKKCNFHFNDKNLLKQALTHRSFGKKILNSNLADNERLEYLGDAVLKLLVSETLFLNNPDKQEGQLTKERSIIIADSFLATLAKDIHLGHYMRFSYGEKKSGGIDRESNLADAFEALLGALYLDQGYDSCLKFFNTQFLKNNHAIEKHQDYKSDLQEFYQKNKLGLPQYKVLRTSGPDHQKSFILQLTLNFNNKQFQVQSEAKSKKEAEQYLAKKMLIALKKQT